MEKDNLFRKTPEIRTYSGKYVNVFDLKPEDIDIVDIAHSLSLTCRWRGICKHFYSVAEHSIYVSDKVPREHKLAALLHDASEAYLGDIPRPVKQMLPDYLKLEQKVEKVIAERFGYQYPYHVLVKEADDELLIFEWNNLILNNKMVERTSSVIEDEFLEHFKQLTK